MLEPTDGFCLRCDGPVLGLGGLCTPCGAAQALERERAELVGKFLGVPACVKCGSVWLHFDERGAPVCAFVFCTGCGKIQPRPDR